MNRYFYEIYLAEYQSFWAYYNSYKIAYDVLLKQIDDENEYINRIGYPLLFMARHCLELGLKANIRFFQKYSQRTDYVNSDSHNLRRLFEGFKVHVNATIKNLEDKQGYLVQKGDKKSFVYYCDECDKLLSVFDLLDEMSFAFRYPIDVKGNYSFKVTDKINLLDIRDTFEKVVILLSFTKDVLGQYIVYLETMEKEIEDMYGDYL